MPKLQPLEINERKISYISYKIYKYQAKLISTKLISCNLNRYECKQKKNFLLLLIQKLNAVLDNFFTDKAMYQHLLLLMKMIL
jgi:hypothetical protein